MKSPRIVDDLKKEVRNKTKDIFFVEDNEEDHYAVAKEVKQSDKDGSQKQAQQDMNAPTMMETSITFKPS